LVICEMAAARAAFAEGLRPFVLKMQWMKLLA